MSPAILSCNEVFHCCIMQETFSTVPSSNITSGICCCLLKFVITNKWNKNYHPLSSPVTFLWQTVAVYWSSLMAIVGGACIRQYQVCGWYVLKYSMPPPFHSSPLLSPLFLKCSNCRVYGMHYRLLFFLFCYAVVGDDSLVPRPIEEKR